MFILAAPSIAALEIKLIVLAIFAIGSLIWGYRDFLRFSWMRTWAISGVCFDESIRRKVLLITPLAILGVIIVSQLQRPLDEQDAIRQTIKFCIFATALVVTITTVILACTNLPREIENRVIYTVVTKPTTRLEIVIGKVIGFARVSFVILLIMGLFSYGYLKVRATIMRNDIANRLDNHEVPAMNIGTAQYYREAGLLNVKSLRQPSSLNIYGKPPTESGTRRYFAQAGHGYGLIGFQFGDNAINTTDEQMQQKLIVRASIGYEKAGSAATRPATTQAAATTGPTTLPYYGPFIMSPEERAAIMAGTRHTHNPTVNLELVDQEENSLGVVTPMGGEKIFELTRPGALNHFIGEVADPKVLQKLRGPVFLKIYAPSTEVLCFLDLQDAEGPAAMGIQSVTIGPDGQPQGKIAGVPAIADPNDRSKPLEPIFRARRGTFGQQVKGGPDSSVAVFSFRNVKLESSGDTAPFELRTGVERSGDETVVNADEPTDAEVQVINRKTGKASPVITVQPENGRTIFVRMPAEAMRDGDFDVIVRTLTKGDYLGVGPQSLSLITGTQPFAWNLTKSLLILWLMAVLVTAVSIFCSTFLSWPIAVVLTMVILLGHWGVEQLGDALSPGIGAQVVTDFGLRDPARSEAVRRTVENLSSFLNFVSSIFPDIGKFPAVEDIARGVAIAPLTLAGAATVTFGFGIPLVLLSYVFLKNKEVAP